jgi:hypothetical protein
LLSYDRQMGRAFIFLLAVFTGCSGDTPIPATPLAGTLNGMPWTAMGAKADNASTPGEKSVYIHPAPVTCTGFGADPSVVLVVPWRAGVQVLGLSSEATVFIYMDNTAHVVFDGRIEILTAPTEVGASAQLRLRASFEDDDDDMFVEGEIAVPLCE